jgi:hypothetical protein
MDPWYFLDLETTVRDGDETLELMDIASVYPNGSWDLNTEGYEGVIIYKGKEYRSIEFDNDNKKLKCSGKETHVYTLIVKSL